MLSTRVVSLLCYTVRSLFSLAVRIAIQLTPTEDELDSVVGVAHNICSCHTAAEGKACYSQSLGHVKPFLPVSLMLQGKSHLLFYWTL